MADLYDHPSSTPTAPAPPPPAPAGGKTDQDYARALYESNALEPGASTAWRSAMSDAIDRGLITRAESGQEEVAFLTDARRANIPTDVAERLISTAVGKMPASAEQQRQWQAEVRERLAQQFGDGRPKILADIDSLLRRAPAVKRALERSGRLVDPRVIDTLADFVRRRA